MAGRRRDFVAPAFIHVDVDDLWAVAECYGITVPPELRHRITEDALPRFRALFSQFDVPATFFIVGRDVESPQFVDQVTGLLGAGHEIANHSLTHRLDFRALSGEELLAEIRGCHDAVRGAFGREMVGFRAPGYGASLELTRALQESEYRYDASLMPSPYGGVFRWMDERLARRARQSADQASPGTGVGSGRGSNTPARKTQYPLLTDAFTSLWPQPIGDAADALVRLPSAVAPRLRLPFQAGVCMRLGWPYFRANFEGYRRLPALPFVFLFHAADLADFSGIPIPFFRDSPFFGSPIERRVELAERFLDTICRHRPIITTEEWLT